MHVCNCIWSFEGFMEKVLVYEKNCVEFNKKIEELNCLVETEYGGSQTFKEVQILVINCIFLTCI